LPSGAIPCAGNFPLNPKMWASSMQLHILRSTINIHDLVTPNEVQNRNLLAGYELHHSWLRREVVEIDVFLSDGTPGADHFFKGGCFVMDHGIRKREVRLVPLFVSVAVLRVARNEARVRKFELDGSTTTADVLVSDLLETTTTSLGTDGRLTGVGVTT